MEPIKPVWRRAFTLDTSQGHTERQTTKSCCACGTLSSQAAAAAAERHSLNFLLQDLRLPLQSNRLSWQHQSVAGCFLLNIFTHQDQVKLSGWIDSNTPTSDNTTTRENQSSTLIDVIKILRETFFFFSVRAETLSLFGANQI